MKIYYDTEFFDDGKTIELISIGMVAENGDELYCISGDLNFSRFYYDDWHIANTLPSLPYELRTFGDKGRIIKAIEDHPDAARIMSRDRIRDNVLKFIIEHSDPKVALWAWYGSYDHVVLAQLWGKMTNLPYGVVPMWTNDLRQEVQRKSDLLNFEIGLPAQPDGQHNALADARWLKYRAEYLSKIDD